MKTLKLLAVLGVLAALSVPAGAVGIPFSQAWNGPLVWHITNWEDSTVYDYNGGLLADNVTPIVFGTAYSAGLVKPITTGIATVAGESAWGIFQVDQILTGGITGPNGISPGAIQLYSKGTSPTDVLGIFYGGADATVTFNDSTNPFSTRITAAGFNYEIFTQPDTIFDSLVSPGLNGGAAARVDINEWAGLLGYDGTGTNTLLAGAERVITGDGQAGMTPQEFFAVFDFSQLTGTFESYISVAPSTEAFDSGGASVGFSGTQNTYFDTNIFPTGGFVPFVAGTTADFRIKGTSQPTNFPWLVGSSDPVTTAFVPEPMTMLGLMLGVGGLAGYIRKRRSA